MLFPVSLSTAPFAALVTPDYRSLVGDVLELANEFGSRIREVIGKGGNVSGKKDNLLHIKASGRKMGILSHDDLVVMDRDKLATLLDRVDAQLLEINSSGREVDVRERERLFEEAFMDARVDQASTLRPSIEVMLHDLLEGTFVLHVHSTDVNTITCSVRGEELTREVFGDAAIWIPYVDPGFILAKTVRDSVNTYKEDHCHEPGFIFMENHGIVVDGESLQEIREKMEEAHRRIEDALADQASPALIVQSPAAGPFSKMYELYEMLKETGLFPEDHSAAIATHSDSQVIYEFVRRSGWTELAGIGPLTPDQVVYCGPAPLCIEDPAAVINGTANVSLADRITQHREQYGSVPRIILVQGGGLIAIAKEPKDTALVYEDAIMIMNGAESFGGAKGLSPRDVNFLDKEAPFEQHRRKE